MNHTTSIHQLMHHYFAPAFAGLLLLSCGFAQAGDIVHDLKSCAQTQDQITRIACYEELGQRVLRDAAEPLSSVEHQPSKLSPQTDTVAEADVSKDEADSFDTNDVMPPHIGGAKFSEEAGIEAPTYRVFVKSCQTGVDKRWFYILENEQIWKQVDRRKIRHKQKKCGFHATISKGRFGYLLQVDGEDRRISINRFR